MIVFYNTLGRKKEEFRPIKEDEVGIYTCGPTVYDFAHIGNMRAYVFADILRRVLEYDGFKVKHIINITDVGHLVSDADEGEDKMMKALKREGLDPTMASMKILSEKYTKAYLGDRKDLNLEEPEKFTKATEYIQEMIELIKKLIANDYTYQTKQGIYFDVSKFPEYYSLFNVQKLDEKIAGVREDVGRDPEKKQPADFALWFFLAGDFENSVMRWPSPWGEGFPGWHIECSAMSMTELGDHFDIHTGGLDHITKHHPNEIAQNWGVTGRHVVNYWIHSDFLIVGGTGRMAKSAGTFITVPTIKEKGFNPLSLRYLMLLAHYRTKIDFSWEALGAAQNALDNIYQFLQKISQVPAGAQENSVINNKIEEWQSKFLENVNDDLNIPAAIALMHQMIDEVVKEFVEKPFENDKVIKMLIGFDKVLGLDFDKYIKIEIPEEIKQKVRERETARQEKDFKRADEIRNEIKVQGYLLDDVSWGTLILMNK